MLGELAAVGLGHAPALFINGELHAGLDAVAGLPGLIKTQTAAIANELAAGQLQPSMRPSFCCTPLRLW